MIDFQSLLKKIDDSYSKNLPFVAYRKPNQNKVQLIVQNTDILDFADDYITSGFIFAPFDSNKKSILFSLENSNSFETKFKPNDILPDRNISVSQNENDKKEHIALVEKGIKFIAKGGAKKIVLSRKEALSVANFSLVETFEKLLNAYINAFVYVWYHPTIGLWLGATPEKLMAIQNQNFTTVSLAATQAYNGSLNVKWGTKELQEQQLVTDYIESNLKAVADAIAVSKLTTVKAGNLLHLSTIIKGSLKNENDLYSLVNQLHPTPAICGIPKNIAKKFILNNENYMREFYTGFLGEINIKNATNLFVNLRCMKVEDSKAMLFLGGGITKDSDAENEWQETVEKSKVMKKVL